MHRDSVPIDGGSGLGAEVAVPAVEIECTDAVFAADACELHAALDPTLPAMVYFLQSEQTSGNQKTTNGKSKDNER